MSGSGMNTVKGTISAGACGFVTEVTTVCEDGQQVSFEISTPCEKIRALAVALEMKQNFRALILILSMAPLPMWCSRSSSSPSRCPS